MPAIAYQSLSALSNSGQTVDTANSAFVIPGGASVGHVCMVTMAKNTGTTTVTTTPTGWTQVGTASNATSPGPVSEWSYYKILESGEPGATVTWVFPTSGRLIGIMEVFNNADSRVSNISSTGSPAPGTSHTIATMTTTVVDTFHYGAWVCAAASATPAVITVPVTHTAGGTVVSAYATGSNLTIKTGWRTVEAAGATGTITATSDISAASASRQIGMWPTALPAAGGTDTDEFSLLAGLLARDPQLVVNFGSGSSAPTTGQLWPRGSGCS